VDTLDFDGLSTSGWSCDSRRATFVWETHPVDIGVHVLEFRAEALNGEPDTLDNAARAVFLIRPRDYAETILENPWDMTEDEEDPPDWYTSDVSDLVGWQMGNTLTDSVSGMFEGEIAEDSLDNNRLYLSIPGQRPGDWIQGTVYDQLSFACRTGRLATMTVGWTDSTGTPDSVVLGDTVSFEWGEYGPFDMSTFPESRIRELWLRFDPVSGNVTLPVRLGWVRLTE
jgi:hypothetical protein